MKKRLTERFEDFMVGIPEERWKVAFPIFSMALNALGVLVGTLVGTAIYRALVG